VTERNSIGGSVKFEKFYLVFGLVICLGGLISADRLSGIADGKVAIM
jgi:hypothetical protein